MVQSAIPVPYFCLRRFSMRKGWAVEYSDGKVINESQMGWRKLPKKNIVRLTLHYEGRRWDVCDKIAYVQKKRGSTVPGVPGSFQVESRSIGYYEIVEGKTLKVWYTVNEFSGQMKMEVENI
jgi:hypothetical protein